MSLMSIITASTDPHLTLRVRAAAVQEGIPNAASWAATHMDRIVAIEVNNESVAGKFSAATDYLHAYVAQKTAEINTPGAPPIKLTLDVEIGAFPAAVSDELIVAAVSAVRAEQASPPQSA